MALPLAFNTPYAITFSTGGHLTLTSNGSLTVNESSNPLEIRIVPAPAFASDPVTRNMPEEWQRKLPVVSGGTKSVYLMAMTDPPTFLQTSLSGSKDPLVLFKQRIDMTNPQPWSRWNSLWELGPILSYARGTLIRQQKSTRSGIHAGPPPYVVGDSEQIIFVPIKGTPWSPESHPYIVYTPLSPATKHKPLTPLTPSTHHQPFSPLTPSTHHQPFSPLTPSTHHQPFSPLTPSTHHQPFSPLTPSTHHKPFSPLTPSTRHQPFSPLTPSTHHKPYDPLTPSIHHQPYTPLTPSTHHQPFTPLTPTGRIIPWLPLFPSRKSHPITPLTPSTHPVKKPDMLLIVAGGMLVVAVLAIITRSRAHKNQQH